MLDTRTSLRKCLSQGQRFGGGMRSRKRINYVDATPWFVDGDRDRVETVKARRTGATQEGWSSVKPGAGYWKDMGISRPDGDQDAVITTSLLRALQVALHAGYPTMI